MLLRRPPAQADLLNIIQTLIFFMEIIYGLWNETRNWRNCWFTPITIIIPFVAKISMTILGPKFS